MVNKAESTREAVLRVMSDGVTRSDAEIAKATGLPHNKVSGGRPELWKAGLLERVEKDENHDRYRWRLCPPERQEEARRAYRDSTERRTRGRLRQLSAGERANIVVDLLADDEVNDALLAQIQRTKNWRRAASRSKTVRAEKEAQRRASRAARQKAMDEADANVEYLQSLGHLRSLIDVLFVMIRHVEAEQDRILSGRERQIPPSSWMPLARNVREVLEAAQVLFKNVSEVIEQPMDSCPLCGERLHSAARHLDEGYIDGEVIEDAEVEET